MVPPLISTQELADALIGGQAPVVLDVRWALGGPPGIDLYQQGHIPSASFVDLDRELAAPPGPGRHPLPEAAAFQAAMRQHGVSESRSVVVYDAGSSTSAARAWWDLKYFGHPDVRVLDGGYAAWVAEGRPFVVGDDMRGTPLAHPPGDFAAVPGGLPMVDAAGALDLAARGVLIDSRAPERFRGEVEPVDAVAGHIPGATNLPTTGNVDSTGHFLRADALRSRFAGVGAKPAVAVGAYCGSGVTAAHTVLALSVAGIDAALYVGSWSEWITDPSRPVATGPEAPPS
jgi:thiosulfate/3-mercaptopyruvate sulfurtransferase